MDDICRIAVNENVEETTKQLMIRITALASLLDIKGIISEKELTAFMNAAAGVIDEEWEAARNGYIQGN